MKILFLYPPIEYFGIGDKLVFDTHAPPLGILYLSTILENEGYDIEVIDYGAQNVDEGQLTMAVNSADAVGMTVLSPSFRNSIKLAKMVKQINPDIPLIIGGPHCSLYPEKSLIDMNVEISVEGDAELIIADIIKALEGEKSFSEIPGVHYRDGKKIKKGPPPEIVKNLDPIQFPARHLIDKYTYGKAFIPSIKQGEFTSMITTRGCPNRCSFCTRQFVGMKTFRQRSGENVLQELKEIYDKGYKYVIFEDDNFLTDKKRALQIVDGIIHENIDMQFYIQGARVDGVTEELFQKMKKAGVVYLAFGIESGNQDVLDFYRKGTTLSEIQIAVELSNKMGFFTAGSFILGAPFETEKHFEKTIRFANSLHLDSVLYFPLDYRAGSALWNDAVKEGKIDPYDYNVPCDSGRGLGIYPRDVVKAYSQIATRRFYFRPSYIFNQVVKTVKTGEFQFIKSQLRSFRLNLRGFFSYLSSTHDADFHQSVKYTHPEPRYSLQAKANFQDELLLNIEENENITSEYLTEE